MTRIELAPEVLDDFDRFFEHIARFDPGAAPQRIGEILETIQIQTHSPLIGCPVKDGKRELVIGRATRGYVALYRYVAAIDTVFLLAVRAQREAGYKHDLGRPITD
jgi:plasmid stabilization system protein ParE